MNASRVEQMEDEAALWAARLRGGGMTDEDRRQLEVWLKQDPGNCDVLARYRELSSVLDVNLGQAAADAAPTSRRIWWRAAGAVAAVGLAAAVIVGVFVSGGETFTTRMAERRVVQLSDGSQVELNARTELRVEYRRGERRVRLERGEALFSVVKDLRRPFVVMTRTGTIQVTGTRFDVRAGDDEPVEVTVLEGHVQVRALGEKSAGAVLDPGEQGTVAADRIIEKSLGPSVAQNVIAWRNGQVVFEDTPLREALSRFADYDARRIEVAPAAADLRVGGRYSLDDVDGALESFERVLPVRVIREAGIVHVVVNPTTH